jgi:hypothetical protein
LSVGGTTISSGITSQWVAWRQESGPFSLGAGDGSPGSGFMLASGGNSFSTVWLSVTRMASCSRADTGRAGLTASSPSTAATAPKAARRERGEVIRVVAAGGR